MRDKLTDVIRIGKVSSIDPIKCTAQVTFEDRDDAVSGDLFIAVPYTLKDKAYFMPAIGERVRVMLDPEAPTKGCILGSFYADTRLPPFGDKDKTYIYFEDKTLVEYDKRLHTLTISVPSNGEKSIDVVTSGDISIKSDSHIKVESARAIEISCVADITLTTNANLTINSDGNTEIKAKGSMTVESAGILTLKGAKVDIQEG